METEYLPPGHPLTWDIEIDLDRLKQRLKTANTNSQAAVEVSE